MTDWVKEWLGWLAALVVVPAILWFLGKAFLEAVQRYG